MGMYTKLCCDIKLKKDERLRSILNDLLTAENNNDLSNIEHPFFKTQRYNFMLRCCSFYFTNTTTSKLITENNYDVLHCDCDLKNYDDEINLFLNWIEKYTSFDWYENKEFIGYIRYEENIYPTLIFVNNNKIVKEEIKRFSRESR